VLAASGPVPTGNPLVTAPTPESMLPAPPVNSAASWLAPPSGTAAGLAENDWMAAAGTTVTVTVRVTGPPRPLAVRV
jgi:hypothetical protein